MLHVGTTSKLGRAPIALTGSAAYLLPVLFCSPATERQDGAYELSDYTLDLIRQRRAAGQTYNRGLVLAASIADRFTIDRSASLSFQNYYFATAGLAPAEADVARRAASLEEFVLRWQAKPSLHLAADGVAALRFSLVAACIFELVYEFLLDRLVMPSRAHAVLERIDPDLPRLWATRSMLFDLRRVRAAFAAERRLGKAAIESLEGRVVTGLERRLGSYCRGEGEAFRTIAANDLVHLGAYAVRSRIGEKHATTDGYLERYYTAKRDMGLEATRLVNGAVLGYWAQPLHAVNRQEFVFCPSTAAARDRRLRPVAVRGRVARPSGGAQHLTFAMV